MRRYCLAKIVSSHVVIETLNLWLSKLRCDHTCRWKFPKMIVIQSSRLEHPGTGQAKPYAVRDCAVRGMVSYAD